MRWGYETFVVEWGSVAGADVMSTFYDLSPVNSLLTVMTTSGEQLDFSIPRHMSSDLKKALGEYLTVPGPQRPY